MEVVYRFWEFLEPIASEVEILQWSAFGEPVRDVPYLIMGQFEATNNAVSALFSSWILEGLRRKARAPQTVVAPLNISFQNVYNLVRHNLNGLVAEIYRQFQFDSLAYSLAASQGLLDPELGILHRVAEKFDSSFSRQYGWHFLDRLPRWPFMFNRVVVSGAVPAFGRLAAVHPINQKSYPG